MTLPKHLKLKVPDAELSYGKNGVTKKMALRAYAAGYMQGVNKKKNTLYRNVKTVKFTSGNISVIRVIKRSTKRKRKVT